MTPVIFITIGFLSCWFLLYALMEWIQDPRRRPGTTSSAGKEIIHREDWNQRVVNFRSKEKPKERKMRVMDRKMKFARLCLVMILCVSIAPGRVFADDGTPSGSAVVRQNLS
jgi:hypothetical protein